MAVDGSLTKCQSELFEFISQYVREHRISPTLREMMRAMGLRSIAPVQSRLSYLRQKGYVDWMDGKARSLRLRQQIGIPVVGMVVDEGSIIQFAQPESLLGLEWLASSDRLAAFQPPLAVNDRHYASVIGLWRSVL